MPKRILDRVTEYLDPRLIQERQAAVGIAFEDRFPQIFD